MPFCDSRPKTERRRIRRYHTRTPPGSAGYAPTGTPATGGAAAVFFYIEFALFFYVPKTVRRKTRSIDFDCIASITNEIYAVTVVRSRFRTARVCLHRFDYRVCFVLGVLNVNRVVLNGSAATRSRCCRLNYLYTYLPMK